MQVLSFLNQLQWPFAKCVAFMRDMTTFPPCWMAYDAQNLDVESSQRIPHDWTNPALSLSSWIRHAIGGAVSLSLQRYELLLWRGVIRERRPSFQELWYVRPVEVDGGDDGAFSCSSVHRLTSTQTVEDSRELSRVQHKLSQGSVSGHGFVFVLLITDFRKSAVGWRPKLFCNLVHFF